MPLVFQSTILQSSGPCYQHHSFPICNRTCPEIVPRATPPDRVNPNECARNELLGKPITISYFPDPSDHDLIRGLTVSDDRVYADGEPLPRIGQTDPDFKPS